MENNIYSSKGIESKSCFCIGANNCNDINCRLVQDRITQEKRNKKENKLSLDELCKTYEI